MLFLCGCGEWLCAHICISQQKSGPLAPDWNLCSVSALLLFQLWLLLFFNRVCAPPYAAVWGGVPAVCLPLDEQPPDEGAATSLHDQTVGHLPGTNRHTRSKATVIVPFYYPSISIYLALHGVAELRYSLVMTSMIASEVGAFVILATGSQPTQMTWCNMIQIYLLTTVFNQGSFLYGYLNCTEFMIMPHHTATHLTHFVALCCTILTPEAQPCLNRLTPHTGEDHGVWILCWAPGIM